MKKRVFEKVIADLHSRVEKEKSRLDSLRALAYSNEDVSSAQSAYTKARFDALKSGDDSKVSSAYSAYVKALENHGFNEHSFDYHPTCTRCGDTGFVDKKPCLCVKKAYIIALSRECDIFNRAPFSFKDHSVKGMDKVQAEALSKLYSFADEYVSKYPAITKNILVFTGATGTGKTCLSSAMARKAVLEKGKSALVLSAYEFNSVCLNTHLAPIEEKSGVIHDALSCDFLVIDDLGTEPMLKNVTLEYLQLVLDERVRDGHSTIITTNLDERQLKERYGERIFSRLTDTRHSLIRRIPGKDLRLK